MFISSRKSSTIECADEGSHQVACLTNPRGEQKLEMQPQAVPIDSFVPRPDGYIDTYEESLLQAEK